MVFFSDTFCDGAINYLLNLDLGTGFAGRNEKPRKKAIARLEKNSVSCYAFISANGESPLVIKHETEGEDGLRKLSIHVNTI